MFFRYKCKYTLSRYYNDIVYCWQFNVCLYKIVFFNDRISFINEKRYNYIDKKQLINNQVVLLSELLTLNYYRFRIDENSNRIESIRQKIKSMSNWIWCDKNRFEIELSRIISRRKNNHDWNILKSNTHRKMLCKHLLTNNVWICANVSNKH